MTTALKATAMLSPASTHVDVCIQRRIAGCPYEYYFNKVTWHFENGRLTLSGAVPTFYLKQVLQTILRDVEQVEQLINNVDVINATGLSSPESCQSHGTARLAR